MAAKIERVCEWCGAQFLTWPSRVKRGHGRFCSSPCRARAVAEMRRGTGGVTLICQHCGDAFRVAGKSTAAYRKHCSRECYAASRSMDRYVDTTGYVRVKHPDTGKRVFEHRLVMSQHIGRPIRRNEHVHHINGEKTDNRIENLQVMSQSEHMRLHQRRITWGAKGVTECLVCGTSERPYLAKGMCSRCYHRHHHRKSRGSKLPSVL